MQNAAINTTAIVYGLSLSPDLGTGFSGGHVAHYYHHIHFNETIQADRRSSSAWSYLYPHTQQRSGLTVLTDHLVDIVTTKAESNSNITATGVTVQPTAGGQTLAFNATREVVISAGTLYSPGVLQRSGIGNATFLQASESHLCSIFPASVLSKTRFKTNTSPDPAQFPGSNTTH
ncbi:hypothetical protein K438DRAFT_1260490 [Mycena galopus ATCC 62051]|nr:hypothetical protein K438DRAFT_1260490 [Mycena galopus ATCC 62051]